MWEWPTRFTVFLINFIPIKLSSTCFEQIIFLHQEVIFVHRAYSILPCIYGCLVARNHIVSANRLLIKMHGKILYAACTEKTSWLWTVICSKHVEDILRCVIPVALSYNKKLCMENAYIVKTQLNIGGVFTISGTTTCFGRNMLAIFRLYMKNLSNKLYSSTTHEWILHICVCSQHLTRRLQIKDSVHNI
jgi:hypothetical protein